MTDRDPLINRSVESSYGQEGLYEHYLRPCITELIAVMLFVFVGTTAAINLTAADPVGIALAHGLTIALLVAATGSISGGHINPAVTLGAFLAGAIPAVKAILYVVFQLLGSVIGAALARAVVGYGSYCGGGGGAHNLAPGVSVEEGVLAEIILTSVLVTTVLLTAVDSETKSDLAPLAIGFAVVVNILAGIAVTGASMNPARSFGPAVVVAVCDKGFWTYHWIYWVGPALGAVLANVWYKFFLASSDNRIIQQGSNGTYLRLRPRSQ